jgi:NAD(P)H-dependent FMN reductase
MQQLDVAVLVGSLRQKSVTRKLAQAITRLSPATGEFLSAFTAAFQTWIAQQRVRA